MIFVLIPKPLQVDFVNFGLNSVRYVSTLNFLLLPHMSLDMDRSDMYYIVNSRPSVLGIKLSGSTKIILIERWRCNEA